MQAIDLQSGFIHANQNPKSGLVVYLGALHNSSAVVFNGVQFRIQSFQLGARKRKRQSKGSAKKKAKGLAICSKVSQNFFSCFNLSKATNHLTFSRLIQPIKK